MDEVRLFNPFLKKPRFKSYPKLSKTAKRIYKDKIKKGLDPDVFLPKDINYNKKKKQFQKRKIPVGVSNVGNLTYQQVKVASDTQGKDKISIVHNRFKNYAGQTIKVGRRYTKDGETQENEQIEDIPPMGDGFGSWWNDFSRYFIYINSENMIFDDDLNEGELPKFQAQLVFLTFDKVKITNYQQFFKDGVTNCLLTPIIDWGKQKYDEAESASSVDRYKLFVSRAEQFHQQYTDSGIPPSVIQEIADKLNITIEIDLPSTINTKVQHLRFKGKHSRRTFKFVNTRMNHVELNEVSCKNNYEEISDEEMKKLFDKLKEEGKFFLWKKTAGGMLKQINTLNKVFIPEANSYAQELEEFEENNGLNNYRINYYDNPCLGEFIQDALNHNCSLILNDNYDESELKHIDMSKSYSRGMDCVCYEGYLAKVTDFRFTDKIMGIGIYQIRKINYGDSVIAERIKKLKILRPYNSYPSPELKYYQSMGITFDIIGGCWGTSTDIEFHGDREEGTGMFEKMDGVSHYCRWYGVTQLTNFFERYSFICDDAVYAGLMGNLANCNIRFNYEKGEGIIEYKKKEAFNTHHFACFVNSYARINLIEQLKLIKGDIIAVQVDGIYYVGEAELTPLFKADKKITIDSISKHSKCYVDSNGKKDYNFGDGEGYYNRVEIHTGEGGCGKTHGRLIDKGLCGVCFSTTPYKLLRTKQEEYKDYNFGAVVVAQLLHSDPSIWGNYYRKYSVFVIDEASMITENQKNELIKRYDKHKLIFCGDLGFQLPPPQGIEMKIGNIPVIRWSGNKRCKCPELKKILDVLRECIEKGLECPSMDGLKFMGIDIIQKVKIDYKAEDLIIANSNVKKDFYTARYGRDEDLDIILKSHKKKLEGNISFSDKVKANNFIQLCDRFMGDGRETLEKYVILNNTEKYSRGEIVYKKIDEPGVRYEVRHGYTIHSAQGETAKNKLFIDMNGLNYDIRLIYTAFSRAEYLHQIVLIK